MTRKQIRPDTRLGFILSTGERDVIVERTFIDSEMEQWLRDAPTSWSNVKVALTLDDVEDLAGHIAAEANHCEDKRVRRSLDAVYDRLSKLEAAHTDEEPVSGAPIRPEKPAPPRYTPRQGQYLVFIYYYTKLHRRPPAEADFQEYFRVSPPSVHQMILTLAARGLIERTPGEARSIRLRLSRAQLPELE